MKNIKEKIIITKNNGEPISVNYKGVNYPIKDGNINETIIKIMETEKDFIKNLKNDEEYEVIHEELNLNNNKKQPKKTKKGLVIGSLLLTLVVLATLLAKSIAYKNNHTTWREAKKMAEEAYSSNAVVSQTKYDVETLTNAILILNDEKTYYKESGMQDGYKAEVMFNDFASNSINDRLNLLGIFTTAENDSNVTFFNYADLFEKDTETYVILDSIYNGYQDVQKGSLNEEDYWAYVYRYAIGQNNYLNNANTNETDQLAFYYQVDQFVKDWNLTHTDATINAAKVYGNAPKGSYITFGDFANDTLEPIRYDAAQKLRIKYENLEKCDDTSIETSYSRVRA